MNVFSLWLTHAVALTLKETRQILRDRKRAILLGVFMLFDADHFVWLRAFF